MTLRGRHRTRVCWSFGVWLVGWVWGAAALAVQAQSLTIVAAGRSDYCIYHPLDALPSVRQAARELQRVVQLATQLELPIVTEPRLPMIELRSLDSGAVDSFRIELHERQLRISGYDVEMSSGVDPWFLPSRGTYYGVLEFLERFVAARWLLPDAIGEDIPRRESLVITLPEPLVRQPSFPVRSLAYVQDDLPSTAQHPKSTIVAWLERQRISTAAGLSILTHGHSWDDYLRPADLEAHPEWKSSVGESVRHGKVTYFCTTAPGVVETFAARVIEWLDRNPHAPGASISPTDGGGFCQCVRCREFLTLDPHGRSNHAQALLTFYRDVAAIVARARPGRRLGAFVYYNYQYPPPHPPRLGDNLYLVWAPLNYYGYGLLKQPYQHEFPQIMAQWSAIAPRLLYHNYSTWMRSYHGAPLPLSLDILRLELPTAARHRAWGARMVGSAAWGVSGVGNYLLAKQMWQADLDVSATIDEWFDRAYGGGGRDIRRLYDAIDERLRQHKQAEQLAYRGSQYEVNYEVMEHVYAPLFDTLEQHYRRAEARVDTDAQRIRLAMLGDNLAQLHFALRHAGLIDSPERSSFYRDAAGYARLLARPTHPLSLYRDRSGTDKGPIWKGEYRAP